MSVTCFEDNHSTVDKVTTDLANWFSNCWYHKGCDDAASAFMWAPGSELQSIHKCITSLMLALLLFFYPSIPHTGASFEPLQMLVRARKSMYSNRDKRGLVLDNSGCLSVHYSLDRRDTQSQLLPLQRCSGDKEYESYTISLPKSQSRGAAIPGVKRSLCKLAATAQALMMQINLK